MPVSQSELFFNSKLKIERAKRHITELNNDIVDYIKSKPYKVVVEKDTESTNHNWTLRVKNKIPCHFAAIIGDAIHNVRASLDLLASDLVKKNGGNVNQVYFPFGNDIADFETMIKKKHIDRAGEDVIKIIRALQPYRGGDEMLRAIHDLDITDKHKALIPSMYYVGIKNFEIANATANILTISNLHIGPIKDGTVIISMPPASNIQVGQHFNPSLKITFGEGQPLQNIPLIEALNKMTLLADKIINTFIQHFSLVGRVTPAD